MSEHHSPTPEPDPSRPGDAHAGDGRGHDDRARDERPDPSSADAAGRQIEAGAGTHPQDDGSPRELVLVKNGQRFVFRCAPGQEAALLGQLGDLVRDPNVDLDWFDAALLSHQVGRQLSEQLERLRRA